MTPKHRSTTATSASASAPLSLSAPAPASSTSTTSKQSCISQSDSIDIQNQHDQEDQAQDMDQEKTKEIEEDTSPSSSNSSTKSNDNERVSGSSGPSTPMYSYPINPPPEGRLVRIYRDGIYDLFHFGHAKALEKAKKSFPDVYLIVGVCDDTLTHNHKGKTVMTDKERYESVRHCKWVDEVVESAPWVIDQAFLDRHKIDYVAHDDNPYKSVDSDDVYAFVKNKGQFLPTQRTEGVSTSDLITRIVKDYDQYLRRNLERGVSAKELGIGFFKEHEVKLKKSAKDIQDSIRQNWHGTRDDLLQVLAAWEDKSHEFVKETFGVDSVVNKIFSKRHRPGTSSRSVIESVNTGSSGVSSDEEGPLSPTRLASPDSREVFDSEEKGIPDNKK
ncbi:hypothetical protein BGZ80_007670 [Entomortierella chlamydospora]|uniref:choline-phosphate cytidylyltransferase n=1 Tax=Entomortierella chlamydospora TaxID=101097 RepID=A0A9P6MXX4_9FUNG|nr:hypothetical protein BGZ80_007670 [Entomortierella chlamydospora]